MRRARPGLSVLLITGYSDEMTARHGALQEGFDVLMKPFSPVSSPHASVPRWTLALGAKVGPLRSHDLVAVAMSAGAGRRLVVV